MTGRPVPSHPWHRLAAFNALAFSLAFVANTLEPALLGSRILALAPESKNTVVGLLTFAGLLVAVVWQPLAGDLSDRTAARWGRRIPYFAGGSGLLMAAMLFVALAPGPGWLLAAVLLVQLASNTIQAPSQALLPDHVPSRQRGLASGWKAALEILSFVAGRQVSARLVAAGWLVPAAAAAGAVVAIGAVLVILATRGEIPAPASSPTPRLSLRRAFAFNPRSTPGFLPWFVNRLLVWGGFIALNTFLLFFVIDVLGLSEPDGQRFVGDLSAVMGLALIAVAIPAGRMADRCGKARLVAAAGVSAAAGILLLVASPSMATALLAGGILGLSVGVFQVASWALATQLVPSVEAGRMLGLANIATAAGSGLARLAGALIIDPVNRWTGSQSTGYLVLYALAGAAFLGGTLAILRSPDAKQNARTT